MDKPCKVEWCLALAVDGQDACVIHAKYPDVHPVEPEPEELEQLADVTLSSGTTRIGVVREVCPDCKGSGDCVYCEGSGKSECECLCGKKHHEVECSSCDGKRTCESCDGSGRADEPEAHRYPDWWRWTPSYRGEVVMRGRATQRKLA